MFSICAPMKKDRDSCWCQIRHFICLTQITIWSRFYLRPVWVKSKLLYNLMSNLSRALIYQEISQSAARDTRPVSRPRHRSPNLCSANRGVLLVSMGGHSSVAQSPSGSIKLIFAARVFTWIIKDKALVCLKKSKEQAQAFMESFI